MIGALGSSLSGLQAASAQAAVAASNLAGQGVKGALPNAAGETPAGQPSAYRPLAATQTALPGGGAVTGLRPLTSAVLPEYDPGASYANADGQVAAPNVDTGQNLVALKTAELSYKANLAVFRTNDEMQKELLRSFKV